MCYTELQSSNGIYNKLFLSSDSQLMTMMIYCYVIILLLFECQGFGYLGHRIVGRMVWMKLDTSSKLQLLKLFGKKSIFLQLSSWPDQIKHDVAWRWTFDYHFINSQDNPPEYCGVLLKKSGDNLLTAINLFYNTLTLSKTTSVVADLAFLIHLLADLHQPLHITAMNHGGTRKYVKFDGRMVPLHLLWDTLLLKSMVKEIMSEERLALDILTQKIDYEECTDSIDICSWRWAEQSSLINCQVIFRNDSDLSEHIRALRRQLHLAALRITHVLAKILRMQFIDDVDLIAS